MPTDCLHGCGCCYSLPKQANIFNCENMSLTHLPETIPENTDWLLVWGNNLGDVLKGKSYMVSITHLNMSSRNVTSISNDVAKLLVGNGNSIDISSNR